MQYQVNVAAITR